MAANAKEDQKKRSVEVNRERLLETLSQNRDKHVAEYKAAMQGYRAIRKQKIEEAFRNAEENLARDKKSLLDPSLSDDDLAGEHRSQYIVEPQYLNLDAPRSYENEYDVAIGIASWDVNETIPLTSSEFACFVLDKWDWKPVFEKMSKTYS